MRNPQVAVTRGGPDCLVKTQVPASPKVCTGADACPVPVCEARVQPGEAPVNGGGNYNPLKVAKFLVG